MSSFEEITDLHRAAVTAALPAAEYFNSDEYRIRKAEGAAIYHLLDQPIEQFLDVVRGFSGGADFGHPEFASALSLPKRLLGKSWQMLEDAEQESLRRMVDQTFRLGLVTHFFLFTYPTRARADEVDARAVVKSWVPSALVADLQMREYSSSTNDLPRHIFEWYFAEKAAPALKDVHRLGAWRRSRVRSFLKNLFFAGARLGMQFDLASRGLR